MMSSFGSENLFSLFWPQKENIERDSSSYLCQCLLVSLELIAYSKMCYTVYYVHYSSLLFLLLHRIYSFNVMEFCGNPVFFAITDTKRNLLWNVPLQTDLAPCAWLLFQRMWLYLLCNAFCSPTRWLCFQHKKAVQWCSIVLLQAGCGPAAPSWHMELVHYQLPSPLPVCFPGGDWSKSL